MSAVLGSADTVCNMPYDAIYHKDNEFGERIARNQLLLLKEEGYFNGASQISEGAYYIESLTEQLAEKALNLFKQLEASGGFLDALKKGTIQQKIKESAQKEQDLFDTGKIIALGTNKYPNPQDRMKDDLELYPFVKTQPRKTLVEPIIEKRLAETMEQKRLNDE
jgi:methylmalonyl-CoA mutase